MRIRVKRGPVGWLAVIVAAAAVALAGCGDSDNESTASAGASTAPADGATTAGGTGLALAEKNLQALYDGSLFKDPPAQSPKPQAGKKVAVIMAGLANTSSAVHAQAAQEAGKALGWDLTVFDGQFAPPKWLEGIQQAIAGKADGILLVNVDCAPVKAALEQARAAGIKVASVESADCSDVDKNAKPLFDGHVTYSDGGSFLDYVQKIGAAQADLVAVKIKGKGKILHVQETETLADVLESKAFQEEIRKVCPDCQLVDVKFAFPELLGPALRQKLEQALLKNPDADALVVPFDDVMTSSGGDAAVRNSGRSDEIEVIGAVGLPEAVEQIRANKGLDATLGFPMEWESWAGLDVLNRLFHGEQPANSGIATQVVERGRNDQGNGGYVPPIDYEAAYRKAWEGQ